jgi:hypothetical protein
MASSINRVIEKRGGTSPATLLRALSARSAAKVGYPEETSGSTPHGTSGEPIAAIAAGNELGTERSPPRPFMRQGAAIFASRENLLRPLVRRMIMGNLSGANFVLTAGELMKGNIEEAVARQDFAPLSEVTIDAKGNNTILIDTSEMVANLDVHIDRV